MRVHQMLRLYMYLCRKAWKSERKSWRAETSSQMVVYRVQSETLQAVADLLLEQVLERGK